MARVRLARGADPMWEILHSVHALGSTTGDEVFGRWRRRCLRSSIRGLGALTLMAPALGYSPDFLTPASGSLDLDAGIDAVLSTPRRQLRDDLGRITGLRRYPPWLADLAAARPGVVRELGALLRRYFRAGLAAEWAQIRAQVNEELLRCGRNLAVGGVKHLLATVSPWIRPDGDALVLAGKPGTVDIHLHGRGLVLQPSFFAYDDVSVLRVPDQPVVLAYPVRHRLDWCSASAAGAPERQLATLMGRTRSHALRLLATDERTTSELAGCLGLSIASASHAARVLRDAGLVVSDQQGKAVVHRASMLGHTLLGQPAGKH
ncbi:ArsR/SmtB family transcription factor [Tenggerimyces flavus]|uniref:ArsR/SmtB family transcription factor n=1 Tax=Tenggerimyces flavus TaxID=1708749 RepID=A0ABV7YJZ4_9ACTN|nr:ArsR family transcriptional regulator [Tenggerimyces flavus]MBM7784749.1 DNA-binding transcriptional ArsR family regulator [Tenggerimyces flavus]